jgi:multidrug resistance protein
MTDKEEVRVNTIDAGIASLNASSMASMSSGNGDDRPREGGDESTVEKGVAPVSAPVEEVSHPASARNWSKKKKWNITLVASAFGFVAPMGTSMLAPALPAMGMDLGIPDQTTQLITLTIFVLAYAFGPLLLGPLAEIYGRIWVMQGASLMCLIFHLGCGFAQNKEQMLAFRFFAGFGASAPQVLCGGMVADCFSQRERGSALRLYMLAPTVAAAIGPMVGGAIAAKTSWRWVFWSLAIAMGVVQICGLFLLQETWEPVLVKAYNKKTQQTSDVPAETPPVSVARLFADNLGRACVMLATQPIIIVVAIYNGYIFGLTYLMLATFAELYTSPQYYHQPLQIACLHYIALAAGYVLGTQTTAYLDDWLYKRVKARYNMDDVPELHLPAMVPGTVMLPVGLLIYGWCADARAHWIFSDIGILIASATLMSIFYCTQRYIVDTYTKYAASALSATNPIKSIAGFLLPLVAPALYDKLSYGWGNSVFALISIVFGVPATWLFWFYGAKLRARSPYATG